MSPAAEDCRQILVAIVVAPVDNVDLLLRQNSGASESEVAGGEVEDDFVVSDGLMSGPAGSDSDLDSGLDLLAATPAATATASAEAAAAVEMKAVSVEFWRMPERP